MITPKEALELKPCPFCGATPHRGLGKVYHDQLHGEPHQDFSIWCPKGHAKVTGVNAALAADEWNTRVTASLQGEDAVERVALAFHSGENVPEVKIGSMQCCIVVTENEQGKHFAFPGYYLNAYPLQYDECRCDVPCEDGCPTTGWFYDESNWEYEDCYYPISSKILRWALIPDASAIIATGLVPDEAAVRAAAFDPTNAQINSACLSFRHDYGLLDDHDRERLRFVAIEWLRAWQKEGFGCDRNEVIERCAAVVDQCNREGPYEAIASAKRIRALKSAAIRSGGGE